MSEQADPPPASRGRRIARAAAHVLLALLVVGLGGYGARLLLSDSGQIDRDSEPERSARLVRVTRASLASHRVTVTAHGEVQASRRLALQPRVAGHVARVHEGFEPGGRVAAGDPLVSLDDAPYRIALERARSSLTQAQADLALEQGQQAVAEREYELMEQEAVSEQERALILRQPQLRTARAQVAAARSDVADAERELQHTEVTAPFDAAVLSREVDPGAEVSTSSELGVLAGIERWWVELAVPVSALRWIEFPGEGNGSGSAVRLFYEPAWGPERHRRARVIRLLDEIEADGRLARVLVAVTDPLAHAESTTGPRLLLGAFVRGEIQGREVADAVAVRPEWLHEGDTVWVMDADDTLAMRPVTVAHRGSDRVLVTEGLSDGDRIVTSPIATPAEGMPLRVAAEDADGG